MARHRSRVLAVRAVAIARLACACQLLHAQATTAIPPGKSTAPNDSSHEPAAMTRITERAFNRVNEDGWVANYNQTGNFSIVQDSTAPRSPSSVGQMKYPKGLESGSAPADLDRGIGGSYRTIYWSWYFKYADNYYGDKSGVNKQGFLWSNAGPDGKSTPTLVPSATGSGNSPLTPQIRLQGAVTSNRDPNVVPSTRVSRGVWHRWELVASLDGGTLDWWLDGVLIGHYTGINFGGSRWETVQFAPNFGGAGGPPMPADTYLWIDHLYVSGK